MHHLVFVYGTLRIGQRNDINLYPPQLGFYYNMEKTISPDSAKAEIAFPKHLGIFMDFTVFVNGFAVRSNECGYC